MSGKALGISQCWSPFRQLFVCIVITIRTVSVKRLHIADCVSGACLLTVAVNIRTDDNHTVYILCDVFASLEGRRLCCSLIFLSAGLRKL